MTCNDKYGVPDLRFPACCLFCIARLQLMESPISEATLPQGIEALPTGKRARGIELRACLGAETHHSKWFSELGLWVFGEFLVKGGLVGAAVYSLGAFEGQRYMKGSEVLQRANGAAEDWLR